MRTLITRSLAALLVALAPLSLVAEDVADLGSLDCPNSGAPEAQKAFVRGVLLLHSFEYEDAREAFLEAQEIDPDFALAYWGESMTHNHPLWRQQDREAGLKALEGYASTPEARRAKAPTEREAAYLASLDILYGALGDESEKADRDVAYSQAMAELAERYPDDMEARAFYALSILGSTQGDRDFATYMRAAAVAEEVFAANDRHPGAIHYMIHSYDDPIHAPLGLRAARVYNEIAPAASHAQHMISHIFVALGQWEDSVQSNVNAYEVSKARREAKGLPVDSLNYHALHWLQYSYFQLGQVGRAREILDLMREFVTESGSSRAAWHYAAMRSLWNVETGGHEAPPPIARDQLELDGASQDLFGDGYVAVKAGDVDAAKAALAALRERIEARAEPEDEGGAYASHDGTLADAEVLARGLEALIALEQGETERALSLLDDATALESSMPLEYGPPDIVKPSHELYGEVLASIGRAADAEAQFETALDRAPRRTRSLLGLAAAAAATNDSETLATACGELSSILAERDSAGPSATMCGSVSDDVAP